MGYIIQVITDFYAHTDPQSPRDSSRWEPLFTENCKALTGGFCEDCEALTRDHGHLNKVAWHTAKFAKAMFPAETEGSKGAREWGYIAGLWHDLGKFMRPFQRKLLGERIQVEHAGAGAALANRMPVKGWEILSFVIAGHHCGLANAINRENADALTTLEERLKRASTALIDCQLTISKEAHPAACLLELSLNTPAPILSQSTPEDRSTKSSLVRMLFSALVDADSIATERFCSPNHKKTLLRQRQAYDGIVTLRERVDGALDAFTVRAENTAINGQRSKILDWCRAAADESPGFFALNVPTGGGKTLASMSFALRHAVKHQSRGMRRVIAAVPYTSIIEQNADVYRSALGENNVIEHHSNIDDTAKGEAEREDQADDEATIRRRLACENWDAPVIVTTNVQFFETLYTNKRGRARKLHNIAGSVIILDEAQCVPVEYLQLILLALRQLVEHFGCTVVVSTATQPAWKHRKSLPCGIRDDQLRPIIPSDANLSYVEAFDRVEIHWPQNNEPLPYEELAGKLAAEECVMAVVHRKKDARRLARMLRKLKPNDALFHLSTNMCPAHRRQVLDRIRLALGSYREHGIPCRIVSTQLIECGCDIDLPVIYRAFAGLDSIAQAAGRCNRENRLHGKKGQVIVFNPETDPPDGHLRHCAEVTRRMLFEHGGQLDIRDPSLFEEYFIKLYRDRKLDAKDLARHVRDLNFETVGREFRLIDDGQQVGVVVAFDEEAERRLRQVSKLATYAADGEQASRAALRALQAYTVNVRPSGFETIRPALEPLIEGSSAWKLNLHLFPSAYDEVFGLNVDDEPMPSSAAFTL